MTKKRTGILPLLVGVAAGAAAVFFSDKKNQDKVKKNINQAKKKVAATAAEAKKNPKAFAQKTAKKAEIEAKKIANKVKKEIDKAKKA